MRLICPNCGAQYEIDTALVPPEGRDVECSACAQVWFQPHPAAEGSTQVAAASASPSFDPDARPELSRELNDSVLAVLREEAARELRARQDERLARFAPTPPQSQDLAESTLTQVEDALPDNAPKVEKPADENAAPAAPLLEAKEPFAPFTPALSGDAPATAAISPEMRTEEAPLSLAAPSADRLEDASRDRDGGNSSLPADGFEAMLPLAPAKAATPREHPARTSPPPAISPPRRTRYWTGFFLPVAVAAVVLAAYLLAPLIENHGRIGASAAAFRAEADQARQWLDQQWQGAWED